MVGKKGYKNSQIQNEGKAKSLNEDDENSEFILDLDELHMNVTPPSELNDNCSPKTEDKRKKVRHHRHILNFAVDTQYANNKCHQCRRKNLKYGLFKCSRKECSILYCAICIKKYNQQFNICFYCQQVCKCKVCRTKFENQLSNEDISEDGNNYSFDKKNMVKIDDFFIIEKKDSEFDINENFSNINESNLKSKNKPINKKNKFNKKKLNDNLNSLTESKFIKINNPKGKLKNLKSNKLKKCKTENIENLRLQDKVTEKVNNDLSGKTEVPAINTFIGANKSDTAENFNKNPLIAEKILEKLPQNDKLYTINNKNKIKKNETLDFNTNHLFSTVNSKINNNYNNKQEKIKKGKIEKGKIENLTPKASKEIKNQGNNLNSNTSDLIKHVEIHNNSSIKSKKTLYKHCLYCKNDKMNVMTILMFRSSEEFILYSKDFFEKLSDEEKRIYKESYSNFEHYYNNYYKKCSQVNNFIFKSIKYICMSCFKENLKEENGFVNILNTLQYGLIPEESKNFNSKKNTDINKNTYELKQNENINLESQLSLNVISKDKCELLGQKKKYNSKISKNNSEEKVQNSTSNPMNFSFLSNNIKCNSDKEIINNLLSFKKFKTSNINDINNNNIANNQNIIKNFKFQNLNAKTQVSNNSPNLYNHLLPPISTNLANQNSNMQSNINSQEYNILNNLINSSNLSNHNISNKTNFLNKSNFSNGENKNLYAQNHHKVMNNIDNLNNSTPRIIFNSSIQQITGNLTSNQNGDNNIIQHFEELYESNSDAIADSKFDDLNNLINQAIDEIYKSTKDTLGNLKEDVNLNNISMIFEKNEGELKNKQNLKNSIDSLKKHLYSINHYSLNQKLILSYLIQNFENLVPNITQYFEFEKKLKIYIDNLIIKLKNSYEIKNHQNSFQINNLINNINSQFKELDNINEERLNLTNHLTYSFIKSKADSNMILEELENRKNKSNSLIDLNNEFTVPYQNINLNLNKHYENLNSISNQNCQTNNNNFHLNNNTNNIFHNIQQPISTSNQNLMGCFGGSNDLFLNPMNNFNHQVLNQNIDDNAKNNSSINNVKLEGNNYQILNSEGSQNNLYIQNNKVWVNYGNDYGNSFNLTDWKNSLFYNNNLLIQNHLRPKIIEDEIFLHNIAMNSNKYSNNMINDYSNNFKNSSQQISQNMLNIGSLTNQYSLQKNMNSITNIANCQIGQNHILDEIVPQTYSNKQNKFNPESQINLYPEMSLITMFPTGTGSLNFDFPPNYVPVTNIQKSQISGISSTVSPILGANLPFNNILSMNNTTTSLNNQLSQQQQQSLKLLNVNNQLPTQLGNPQYINSLKQTQNNDFLTKYPGGLNIENIQSNNGENPKPQLSIIGGMSINQK